MECKSNQFAKHVAEISAILQRECGIPGVGALVAHEDFQVKIRSGPMPFFRPVTTEFGVIEYALELPISTQRHQRKYWVGLHEAWQPLRSKHKIRFSHCSLRLYVGGADREPAHFLRLEWVAPDESGSYQGKHAGHPHWHVDRVVLAGSKILGNSIDDPVPEMEASVVEEFGPLTASEPPEESDSEVDCSWIQKIHLPAQAGWINKWDGVEIPGPHQSEPDNFEALENWWTGSLRYFVHELNGLRF